MTNNAVVRDTIGEGLWGGGGNAARHRRHFALKVFARQSRLSRTVEVAPLLFTGMPAAPRWGTRGMRLKFGVA